MTGSLTAQCLRKTELQNRLTHYARLGCEAINDRIADLEREWSAGRLTKAVTGVAILSGVMLAVYHDPLWLALPALASVFLLQYLFFRRSLLAEAFQAMGWRTGCAIDDERLGLRALRGDFRNLPTVAEVADVNDVRRMQDEGGPAMDDDEQRYDAREAAILIAEVAR